MIQNINYFIDNMIFFKKPKFHKVELTLHDNEKITGCYLFDKNNTTWLMVIPGGLVGTHKSLYCDEICSLFPKYNIFIVNHRGCGGAEFSTTKSTFHWDTDTIMAGYNYICSSFDVKSIYLIGISMGAFMVTKFLGKYKNCEKIKGSVCFAHYFSLSNHTDQVMKSYFLHQYTLNSCNRLAKQAHGQLHIPKTFNKASSLHDAIRNFILSYRNITMREYLEISTIKELNTITVPSLYVNALDDPVCPEKVLRTFHEQIYNNNIQIHITSSGSHIGWTNHFLSSTIDGHINSIIQHRSRIAYLLQKLKNYISL